MLLALTTTLHISTTVLSIISGSLIPLITAWLVKDKAAAWVNALATSLLAIVGGAASAAIGNSGYILWQPLIGSVLLTGVTAVILHFFPSAVTQVKVKTKGFGVG